MMNLNRGILVFSMMIFAGASSAADWGGKEVQASSNASLEAFLAEKGTATFLTVNSVAVEVTAQKNAAKSKIGYMDGATKKTKSYFCHTHDGQIDCH